MIIVVGFLVAMLTVPLFGGRLGEVTSLTIRDAHLVLVAFAIQTLVISFVADDVPEWMSVGIHLYSYLLALMFVVQNRRIKGLAVLALGAALNTIAIVMNGGVMPASAWAQRTAGLIVEGGFANSDVAPDSWFMIFGDMFAVPKGLPLANVFSIGDVLLVVGAGVILHHACSSRLTRNAGRSGRVPTSEHELHTI